MMNGGDSDTDLGSIPEVSDTSVGSSVSSRLQEEYESLLKYALVTPAGAFHGGEDDVNQTEDQIRLLRSSNPNPTPLPTLTTRPPSASSVSSMSAEEPVKLETACVPAKEEHNSNNKARSETPVSMNTTDGEKAREMSVQNRVFGSLPNNTGHQSSGYTLDELDVSSVKDDQSTCLPDPTPAVQSQAISTAHDSDLLRLEEQIDEWNVELRHNILAELTQIKLKLLQQQKSRIIDEREKNNQRMARMTLQNEELKELVANCERTISQKDSIIANLTTSLNKQKTKEGLMRSFSAWKLRHSDEKREEFCSEVASDYHARRLVARAFRAWQGLRESKWKERVERACQNRAQEVCERLTSDYEGKVATLQRQLAAAQNEIAGMRADREHFEERMKKGFMRGVCALNLEAMTMFRGGEEDTGSKENVEPIPQPHQSMPVYSENPLPNLTTSSHVTQQQSRGTVKVRMSGTGGNRPPKQVVPEVVIERHSGPTHHAPPRVPAPKKHRPKLSVKVVE